MSAPAFSLAYTSVRPLAIPKVVDFWTARSTDKNLEWVIAVDDDACFQAAETVRKYFTTPPTIQVVRNDGPKNCVAGWNLAASKTTSKVIIAVSDDFLPPNAWNEHLLGPLLPDNWPDGEYVIHVNDGYIKNLCTLAIITRKRYEKFGYLFYPEFYSLFSDTELTEVAYRDGVVIEAMHLLFEHLHPDCNKRPRDQVDLTHASKERWNHGEMLFNFRKARGFPLDAGPKAAAANQPTTPEKRHYAAYLQVTRDDFCLYEVCTRLREEGVNDFFLAVPDEYWDGRKTPAEDIKALGGIIQRLRVDGALVRTKIFRVTDYRYNGDTRIDTETRLRNDSLAWVRADGFQHILIVDGDELWLRGTLDTVDRLVDQGHHVISCGMIPTVGLPGYPVEGATDLAVVYVGDKCQFKGCRTPFLAQTVIKLPRVIHFSATRRTMEEIIAKHRTGGHYDDPDYNTEEFISNVLPRAVPGFEYRWSHGLTGIHFYRKHQIWPKLRHWRPEEWNEIPDSIKQYLGAPPVADAVLTQA
jgi:hypothetical protein